MGADGQWAEARAAARYPAMCRTAPPRRPRGILAPNAHSAENEKFLLTEQHCII